MYAKSRNGTRMSPAAKSPDLTRLAPGLPPADRLTREDPHPGRRHLQAGRGHEGIQHGLKIDARGTRTVAWHKGLPWS